MAPLLTIVPIEIIEEIINNVALSESESENKYQDTKACSLTCHAFLYPSRKHIFRVISVYESEPTDFSPPLLRSFEKLLIRNPEIGNYVRELTYAIPGPESKPEDSGLSFLEQLANLEFLAIRGQEGFFLWDTLHSSSRSPLLHLMRKPTVVYLSLSSISHFTLSDLIPCIQVQSLDLHQITFTEKDDLLQPLRLVHLRELHVDGETFPFLMKKLDENQGLVFDLRGIERITLLLFATRDFATTEPIARFLEGVGKLTYMHISAFTVLPWVLPSPYIRLATPFLSTLRSLSFDTHFSLFDPAMYGLPFDLQTLTEAGTNCIETLRIVLKIEHAAIIKHRGSLAGRRDGWAMFEDLILGPNWPSMKYFELTIHAFRDSTATEVFQAARQRLSRLSNLSLNGSSKFKYLELTNA